MHLTDCFTPCFVTVLDILAPHRHAAGAAGIAEGASDPTERPVDAARRACQESLDRAVETAASFYETRTLMVARRLVTAWVDERLGSDAWPGRDAWLARPLHSEWHEGRRSGEWFFATAGGLTPGKRDHDELARLALRCLSLGLEGPHFDKPDDLVRIRRDMALRFECAAPASPFPPPVQSADAPAATTGRGLWAVPLVLAALVALAALVSENALNRRLDALLATPPAATAASQGDTSL